MLGQAAARYFSGLQLCTRAPQGYTRKSSRLNTRSRLEAPARPLVTFLVVPSSRAAESSSLQGSPSDVVNRRALGPRGHGARRTSRLLSQLAGSSLVLTFIHISEELLPHAAWDF